MKLCKLTLYAFLALLTVTIFGGIVNLSPYIRGVLLLIIIYSAINNGVFTGTVVGAFTGAAAGAFTSQPLMYALLLSLVGFAFGALGNVFIKKNYVNIIICVEILCLINLGTDKVDITIYAQNVFITLAVTAIMSPIMYIPLKAINKIGRIRWKKKENL